MSKLFWEEQPEWIEQEQISINQFNQLSVAEKLERERVLADFLEAYRGRWVLIKNQTIQTSAATLAELIDRGATHLEEIVEGKADGYPLQVPEEKSSGYFLEQAA